MISTYNVGNFNAIKVSVGPGRTLKAGLLRTRLSLQGVNSNYLVYSEDADKNHDVEAFVINTYNLFI